MQRKAWRIQKAGSLLHLKLVEEPLAGPEPDEVTVEVRSVGLNFADIFACLGLYSATPRGSFVPGLEFAGIVAEPNGTGYARGDHIFGVTRFGAYASHLNIHKDYIHPLPRSWSFEEGAAFPAQALTAWYALSRLAHLRPGENVLVHSAAGGVGLFALDIISKLGASAVATIGDDRKRAFLTEKKRVEKSQIIVRKKKTFRDDLARALNGRRLDVVLDSVGGPYFSPAFDILSPTGRYVLFGFASMMPRSDRPNYFRLAWQYMRRPRLDPLALISENKTFSGFNLIWLWERRQEMNDLLREILPILPDPPSIGHRFPFESAPDAMRLFQTGKTTGKVILEL